MPDLYPASSHTVALESQARAIRLAAQWLETRARYHATTGVDPLDSQPVEIQRKLGTIRANLDALFARFGKADR